MQYFKKRPKYDLNVEKYDLINKYIKDINFCRFSQNMFRYGKNTTLFWTKYEANMNLFTEQKFVEKNNDRLAMVKLN